MHSDLQPNENKELMIEVDGAQYARLPIKTHVITDKDKIDDVCTRYVSRHFAPGDLLFISERIVAISQGRAYPITEIKPSLLAKLLVKFVHKSPHGIGLGSPWTMQLALREAGVLRMLLAALAAAITKPLGIRGVFYHVVGHNINAIDGPCDYTLPPYNHYAKLGPKDPEKVAVRLAKLLKHDVVIIDANDLGVAILGKSAADITDDFCKQVFRDNPLGQSAEQTPLCIVRKLH
jgi:F420-0:gamma-glutamyl ligase-like protein